MKNLVKVIALAWLIFTLSAAFGTHLLCQEVFQKTYGHVNGNEANSVTQTRDGGYAVAGWYDVDGLFSAEFYLVLIDSAGDTLWTKTYGSSSEANAHILNGSGNEGYHLMQTKDNGFLFTGERHFVTGGQSDAYVIKLSEDGTLEWSKIYGGLDNDYGYKAIETDDGYVIGGFTESFGSGIRDMYLFKIDSIGNVLWNKSFGGDSIDAAFDLIQTDDEGFILVGYTFSFSESSDIYLIHTDKNGELLWEKSYGGNSNDIGFSITQSQDGGYIICGESESFGVGEADLYVIKIDVNGTLEWSNTYGGEGFDTGRSITQSSTGEYCVAGHTRSFGEGGEDAYLIILDEDGNLLRAKTFGGELDDAARSITTTLDGGYLICGYTKSFGAGFSDMYLIKTDNDGKSCCCDQESNNSITTLANTDVNSVTSSISEGMTVIVPNTRTGKTSTQLSNPCEISSTEDLLVSNNSIHIKNLLKGVYILNVTIDQQTHSFKILKN